MNFCDINPFVRFAAYIFYSNSPKNPVWVSDCRILYITSGKADLFIESEHYELVSDSLFYCPAKSVYNIQSTGAEIIALNFDLTQSQNMHIEPYARISVSEENLFSTKMETIDDNEFVNSYLFITNANDFLRPILKIVNEFSTQKIHYREKSSALLKDLLVELYRFSISITSRSTTTISQILDYIKDNYDKELNNTNLSDISGYHKNYLNRLFVKYTGMSIRQYILHIRIDEAKKLLLTTEQPLTYISEKVGFNSNTYFSNYFKQAVGISPLEFRKQFKNKL